MTTYSLHLSEINLGSLLIEVWGQVQGRLHKILGCLEGVQVVDENSKLTHIWVSLLHQTLIYAQGITLHPQVQPGSVVGALENELASVFPDRGRPWMLKNKDPETQLDCILRAAQTRLALTAALHEENAWKEGIPLGWIACLADLPVSTMRVYVSRENLRTKNVKQGYLDPNVALAWLEARGVGGPPISAKPKKPKAAFVQKKKIWPELLETQNLEVLNNSDQFLESDLIISLAAAVDHLAPSTLIEWISKHPKKTKMVLNELEGSISHVKPTLDPKKQQEWEMLKSAIQKLKVLGFPAVRQTLHDEYVQGYRDGYASGIRGCS